MDWQAIARQAVEQHGAAQHPGELGQTLKVIAGKLKPAAVVEVGAYRGGSAWAWCQLPTVKRVITIDRDPQVPQSLITSLAPRLIVLAASSEQPSTFAAAYHQVQDDSPRLVVIDGAHDYHSANIDWLMYSQLAAGGGAVIVHDIAGHPTAPDIDVPKLWARIRADHEVTEIIADPGGPCGTGIVWL